MIGSVCARDIHKTTFNALSTHQLLLFICLFLVFFSLSRSLGVFRCSFSISLREYNTCVSVAERKRESTHKNQQQSDYRSR